MGSYISICLCFANGSNGWYFDDWIDTNKHPGVAIVSCNDGLRPLIIKLERIE